MQAAFLFLLISFLIILGILISMLYVVRQQSVAIVERFGRYQKIATSGIHMRLPFGIDKIAARIQLRLLQSEIVVETKTKDNVFVMMNVATQYRVNEQINFQDGLTVMLFVGVNGVGKTTSIGKLAHKYKQEGKKVMLVAADTFRAGAVAQLVEWGRRVEVPVVTGAEKADPASVVFDGMEKALAEDVDVLMIDTAGRLQNKDNLMAELEKIGRIIKRVVPEAPHETLLALDASTGQNALSQAKEFSKITPLTGLILTKLDGSVLFLPLLPEIQVKRQWPDLQMFREPRSSFSIRNMV